MHKWTNLKTESHGEVSILQPEASLPAIDPTLLNFNQYQAYDIIKWHLDQPLSGNEPPPLTMVKEEQVNQRLSRQLHKHLHRGELSTC